MCWYHKYIHVYNYNVHKYMHVSISDWYQIFFMLSKKSKFQFRSKFKLKFCFKYTVWYCSYAIFCMFVTYMVFFFQIHECLYIVSMHKILCFSMYKFHNMFKKKFHRYQINFPTCIQIKKDFIEILKYLSLTFELT